MLLQGVAQGAPFPVAIVLYPFTLATSTGMATALLQHHVAYHLQLGFSKVIQYTQARQLHVLRPYAPAKQGL